MPNVNREPQRLSPKAKAVLAFGAAASILTPAAFGRTPSAEASMISPSSISSRDLASCAPHAPEDGWVDTTVSVRVRRFDVPLVAETVTHTFANKGEDPTKPGIGVRNIANFKPGETETMGLWEDTKSEERVFSGPADGKADFDCEDGRTIKLETLTLETARDLRRGGRVRLSAYEEAGDGIKTIDTKTENGKKPTPTPEANHPSDCTCPLHAPAPTATPQPVSCPDGTTKAVGQSTKDMTVCLPVPGKPPVTGN